MLHSLTERDDIDDEDDLSMYSFIWGKSIDTILQKDVKNDKIPDTLPDAFTPDAFTSSKKDHYISPYSPLMSSTISPQTPNYQPSSQTFPHTPTQSPTESPNQALQKVFTLPTSPTPPKRVSPNSKSSKRSTFDPKCFFLRSSKNFVRRTSRDCVPLCEVRDKEGFVGEQRGLRFTTEKETLFHPISPHFTH